jgi:uncharacterized protein (UPF0218 family)
MCWSWRQGAFATARCDNFGTVVAVTGEEDFVVVNSTDCV